MIATSAECVKLVQTRSRKEAESHLNVALDPKNVKNRVILPDKQDDYLNLYRKRVYTTSKKACDEAHDCMVAEVKRANKALESDNARLKSEKVRRNDVIRKQGIASRRLQSELDTNKRHLSLADAAKKALKKEVTAEQVKNNGLNLKLQANNAELVTTNATLTGFKRRFKDISVLASQHATRETSPLTAKRANTSSMTRAVAPFK